MVWDEDLPYRDQVDVVAGFCEQEYHTISGKEDKQVALLDDWSHRGENLTTERYRRLCGPLTSTQLRAVLRKQRFLPSLKLLTDPNHFEEGDVARRILFLTDLNPSTMEAVLATAPRSQALALKNLFYKYLTAKASVGVTIPSIGFRTFTFELHLPFYVLKASRELLEDGRKTYHGEPLRRAWHLPFLSEPKNMLRISAGDQCLFESQISISVTGIDHHFWTAYGLFDTYYGSNETANSYHEARLRTNGLANPLAAGRLLNPIVDPRQYFFRVCEARIIQVRREWNVLVDKLDNEVKTSKRNADFPLEFDHAKTRQAVLDVTAWNREMVKLLRRLRSRLEDTVNAWDRFQKAEVGYFLFDDDSPTASTSLRDMTSSVDTIFWDLKEILKKLESLQAELCQDSPQGLNAHYTHGNHEAQLFQQKIARHIQILTIITIVYLPLALGTAVFSTNSGVLPFTPNFGRFIISLFILTALMVAWIAALLRWQDWSRLMNKFLSFYSSSRKPLRWDVEHGEAAEEVCTPPRPKLRSSKFKWRPFSTVRKNIGSQYSRLRNSVRGVETHQNHEGRYHGVAEWLSARLSPTRGQTPITITQSCISERPMKKPPFRAFTNIRSVLKKLVRHLPEAEKQRIEWTCVRYPFSLFRSNPTSNTGI
ncbi:hypothetical protein N431DRAFT_357282 [Stipitochalara longipes BDJ]|nr:hypothetical protein N431DRAFT_357282 [Stipitochalara longipes BDJ]